VENGEVWEIFVQFIVWVGIPGSLPFGTNINTVFWKNQNRLQSNNISIDCLLFKLFDDTSMQLIAEVFNRSLVHFEYNGCIVVRQLTFRLCVSAQSHQHVFLTVGSSIKFSTDRHCIMKFY